MLGTLIGIGERRSIENPALSLNDPSAWEDVFGQPVTSGIRFGPRSGFRYAPVWRAVSMISGDVARLPLNVYHRTGDQSREKDRRHPAHRIVRRQANPEQSAFRFWRQMMVNACYWNHSEALIDRNGRGDAVALYPLLPDRTAPKLVNGIVVYVTEITGPDGKAAIRAFPSRNILAIKGPHWNEMEPCELVAQARDSWALGLAEQNFASKFFAAGGRAGGLLELPLGSSKNYADKLEEGFRKTYESADAWFKTVILRDGAKFHQANRTPQEGQAVEAREEQVRDVARWFNLQPSRLGVTGSTSYNSRSEDNQEYLDTTLSPWLTDIAQECEMKLLSGGQQAADSHYFEHNTDSLLRMDTLKRYQAYAIGVRNHIITPNEIRQRENMNPLDGGDEFPTLTAQSDGGADKGENDRPRGEADDTGEDDGTEDSRALRRIAYGVARHAREKAAKGHRAFGEWITGDLLTHRQDAQRLVGTDGIVDDVLIMLREAEDVPVAQLTQTVERIADAIERAY